MIGKNIPIVGRGRVTDSHEQGPKPAATTTDEENKRKKGLIILILASAAAGAAIVCILECGGLRSLRRYLFEASLGFVSSNCKRTVLMGTAEGLASALRQISFHPEIRVVRLLSPDARLHGNRLAGFHVTGGPDGLAKYLTSEQIDLVLVADAS